MSTTRKLCEKSQPSATQHRSSYQLFDVENQPPGDLRIEQVHLAQAAEHGGVRVERGLHLRLAHLLEENLQRHEISLPRKNSRTARR